MLHPYGVSINDDIFYVSNQDTNSLLRYSLASGKPLPLPIALKNSAYPPGTFAIMKKGTARGITLDGEKRLYVANDLDGVIVYNISSGYINHTIEIPRPIGLFYDFITNLLYVGSDDTNPTVISFVLPSMNLKQVFSDSKMTHPSGILVYNEILYVLSNDNKKLIAFDVATGKKIGTIISKFPDKPEQIILSPC